MVAPADDPRAAGRQVPAFAPVSNRSARAYEELIEAA
jgi:hypothetical protein